MNAIDLTQSLAIIVLCLTLMGYGVILWRLMGIMKNFMEDYTSFLEELDKALKERNK